MVKIDSKMEKFLDVSEEEDKEIVDKLKEISKEGDVFLALIAPYVGVKVTPSKEVSASMGLSEEFGVETAIEKIKESKECKNLFLLLNSPGGLVQSSYKVARALRNNFENIIVFIPHVAASGGALVALTGNQMVMGMMSQLTPLDPHGDDGVSALSVIRSFNHVTDWFKKLSPEDAPYTYKVLAESYEGVNIDACISALELMKKYVSEILKGAGYKEEDIDKLTSKMVEGYLTHGDVINLDEAKKIGLNAVDYKDHQKIWSIFREWLSKYLLQSADKHIIRYVLPNEKKGDEDGGEDKKNE